MLQNPRIELFLAEQDISFLFQKHHKSMCFQCCPFKTM